MLITRPRYASVVGAQVAKGARDDLAHRSGEIRELLLAHARDERPARLLLRCRDLEEVPRDALLHRRERRVPRARATANGPSARAPRPFPHATSGSWCARQRSVSMSITRRVASVSACVCTGAGPPAAATTPSTSPDRAYRIVT